MSERITSRKNPAIKLAAKLVSSAAFRRETGLFVAEGARLCRDAADSGLAVTAVYATPHALEKYDGYLQAAVRLAGGVTEIEPHVAELLADTRQSQGIFCVCRLPQEQRGAAQMPPDGHYLALEQVQDPGNLGAVLRTAEALGINGVLLLGDSCDLYAPKTLRAAMGAVFRIPVYAEQDTAVAVQQCREKGLAVLAAAPDARAKRILTVDFAKPTVLLVGNEGNGLSRTAIALADDCVTIPMAGRAESLNAAGAAAILMWEMMRNTKNVQGEEAVWKR